KRPRNPAEEAKPGQSPGWAGRCKSAVGCSRWLHAAHPPKVQRLQGAAAMVQVATSSPRSVKSGRGKRSRYEGQPLVLLKTMTQSIVMIPPLPLRGNFM